MKIRLRGRLLLPISLSIIQRVYFEVVLPQLFLTKLLIIIIISRTIGVCIDLFFNGLEIQIEINDFR